MGFPSPVLYVKPELTDNILRVVAYLPIRVTLNQKTSGESEEVNGPVGSTHTEPMRTRLDMGAEVDNNIAPHKKNFNSESATNFSSGRIDKK